VGGVTRHPGGAVVGAEAPRVRTGGWRTAGRPSADLSRCVNCLLCWLYSPDSAVVLEGETFTGFDLDVCKGCRICVEMCPTGAITMVPEADDAP
jgi:2-oxoacid:acceptor oxidoreductase delta subunit (pyruvate/2-ketoisovalerate family)